MQAWTSGHLIPAVPPTPTRKLSSSPGEPGTSIPDSITGWGQVGVLGGERGNQDPAAPHSHHLPFPSLTSSPPTAPSPSGLTPQLPVSPGENSQGPGPQEVHIQKGKGDVDAMNLSVYMGSQFLSRV